EVENKAFYHLNSDGSLTQRNDVVDNFNRNANFFNVDMVYTWQFGPGSFLNVVWKNASVSNTSDISPDYIGNLRNTLQSNPNNNLSLKVIYFMDYATMKKWAT